MLSRSLILSWTLDNESRWDAGDFENSYSRLIFGFAPGGFIAGGTLTARFVRSIQARFGLKRL
jgi:hypothetical protein